MAIVQISQIQHRRGLQQDLPQLASAELGWALDTRRLYIGNGTPEEGAPIVGNTEILTQYSDILATLDTYSYKGDAAGYTVQTGTSALNPVVRSVQEKLDDFVSSRDFGTKGEGGSTDEAPKLNWAVQQLYNNSQLNVNPRVRRTLILPPGTYHLYTNSFNLFPYTKIQGAGSDRTIIVQKTLGMPVIRATDSLAQTGGNIGTNSAVLPAYVEVEGVTLINENQGDVLNLDSIENAVFRDVKFVGSISNPNNSSSDLHAVRILSSIRQVKNIAFYDCQFSRTKFVTKNSANCDGLTFVGCQFSEHYRAFELGDTTQIDKPKNVKVQFSVFDQIAAEAISAISGVSGVVSSYNIYKNVGNSYSVSPTSPVIKYANNKCYSIGDIFSRTQNDDVNVPTISHGGSEIVALTERGATLGMYKIGNGTAKLLIQGQTIPANTGIALTPNIDAAVLNYTIVRQNEYRTGVIRIVNGSTLFYDEDYVENTNVGVDLFVQLYYGVPTVFYTSSANPNDSILYINIEHFKTYDGSIPNTDNLYFDGQQLFLDGEPLSV